MEHVTAVKLRWRAVEVLESANGDNNEWSPEWSPEWSKPSRQSPSRWEPSTQPTKLSSPGEHN